MQFNFDWSANLLFKGGEWFFLGLAKFSSNSMGFLVSCFSAYAHMAVSIFHKGRPWSVDFLQG